MYKDNNKQLSLRRRQIKSISMPRDFSSEEMVKDWTLTDLDKLEIQKYSKKYRLFASVQMCSVRIYGRFLSDIDNLSPKIINYLNSQLGLPPSLKIYSPERKHTYLEQRKNILEYLGFSQFDGINKEFLISWITKNAEQGMLPNELINTSEKFLISKKIMLPGSIVLERLIINVCTQAHENIFESIFRKLSPSLKESIDKVLSVDEGEQRSYFYKLKEYPPSAKIGSLKKYLKRYKELIYTGINEFTENITDSAFLNYLFRLTKSYSSKHLKQFKDAKKYAMMICFLLESQKILLDHIIKMHDQFMMNTTREVRNIHEKKYREFRKKQSKAIDTVIDMANIILNLPENKALSKNDIWQRIEHDKLLESLEDLHTFKRIEEHGYSDILLLRYPSFRKYFTDFIKLPFECKPGSEYLITSINIIRDIDSGLITSLPQNIPLFFVPKELKAALFNTENDNINRNAWEMGLALAIKDATRSGDLYLPKSKQFVSFWNLVLSEKNWLKIRDESYIELNQPKKDKARETIISQFQNSSNCAIEKFNNDDFAIIINRKLKLKREDKVNVDKSVNLLQKTIDASMPYIRIEQLLMDVDKQTGFSKHFIPIQHHRSRPKHFYKTLIAGIISQATNLGVVTMSKSVKDITIDMMRHVLHFYVREETIQKASAEIVNHHHKLPFSSIHGSGSISSSDAQRFKIRADSLLASYYPKYFGYYEKAVGIYTHVSDQYSVYSTKVISCSPREALYVLDGILENNTILKIREHTTDTHGYTEIIFALCHLLGFYFMPRIKDLKDQQLYRSEKNEDNGIFSPLLNKTVDMDIIEEQWDQMIRVAISLKKRTAPAHIIVQRLTSNHPSDRLSKAFTNLGRLIKTEYILRYITDPVLRRTVQRQLNKGEYRHKLPRWIFFADQGEFTVGDYEEIMNKVSCLSLVSNAILYWNTIKIDSIIKTLRKNGEIVEDELLSHISLLPFKHVLPNGTYFI